MYGEKYFKSCDSGVQLPRLLMNDFRHTHSSVLSLQPESCNQTKDEVKMEWAQYVPHIVTVDWKKSVSATVIR